MADQSVSDVLAVRGYKGDSIAGGSQSYGVTIDPSPFDKLAQFTFYQNRDLWERKNKEDDAAALKIADMTALDPSSTNPEVYSFLNNLKEEVLKDALSGGTDYQRNPETYIRMNKNYSKFSQYKAKAAANQVKELGWENLINGTDEPALKNQIQSEYDNKKKEHYGEGLEVALGQKAPIESFNPIGKKAVGVPALPSTFKTKTFTVGFDDNTETQTDFAATNEVLDESDRLAMGLQREGEYKPSEAALKDPAKRKEEEGRFKLSNEEKLNLEATVNKFNTFFEPFKADLVAAGTDDEKFNAVVAKIKSEAGQGSDMLLQIIQSNWNFNKQVRNANKELQRQHKRLAGPITTAFREIPIADGLSNGEYIAGNALYGTTIMKNYATDGTHTGEGSQNRRTAQTEAGANYRANLPYEKAKISAAGAGGANKIEEIGIDPLKSITATIGGLNKPIKLSDLSKAQVNAINPNFYETEGTDKGKLINPDKQISVGTQANGDLAIFILDENGKKVSVVNESSVLSNAASFDALDAKDRKGEDPYRYKVDFFNKAVGNNINGQATPATIPTIDTQTDFDKLPSGSQYIDKQTGKQSRKP